MRWGLVLAVLIAATATAGQASTRPAPSLRLVQRTPIVISGRHFRARERVTVTIDANGRLIRHSRATELGTWRVRLAGLTLTSCEPLYVDAVGRRGSKAHLTVPPAAECAAP